MKIFVHDEFDPEAMAMLQALYSRSAESVETHVGLVRERGSAKFMSSYYVGYGHASIGDCGTTTIFIENVSILACKAIQNNALYSGQETSTRYIDFSQQEIIDPTNSERGRQIHRNWITFYEEAQEPLIEALKSRFPKEPDEKETRWEKAIQAKCFDILRGFLPAGVCSQLSWSTNLRQAHDNLSRLSHHPLAEVREVANECRAILQEKYPSSFSHKVYPENERYAEEVASASEYFRPPHTELAQEDFQSHCSIDNSMLEEHDLYAISSRPKYAALPVHLGSMGHYRCSFLLDFGSFRDLQRHRNGICKMPLLTPDLGFHEWYLEQLPIALREKAAAFLASQLHLIEDLVADFGLSVEDRQYYLPLGLNVFCDIMYDLPQMVYVAELRAGKTVHPTLRRVAQKMANELIGNHPKLVLYADMDINDWDVRRGDQDIVKTA